MHLFIFHVLGKCAVMKSSLYSQNFTLLHFGIHFNLYFHCVNTSVFFSWDFSWLTGISRPWIVLSISVFLLSIRSCLSQRILRERVFFLHCEITFAQDDPRALLKKNETSSCHHIVRLLVVHSTCLSLNYDYPEKWWLWDG